MEHEHSPHCDRSPLPETGSTAPEQPRALTLDIDLYQSYLDEADLSEDERHAYLEALWRVIVGFIDLGFTVKPSEETCGELRAAFKDSTSSGSDPVDSSSGGEARREEVA